MNKQELKSSIKDLPCFDYSELYVGGPTLVNLYQVLALVDKMDEPQKVTVPKFVAEKITYCKANSGYNLFHAMDYCFEYKDSADWLECNEETFARAWLDGYEVENG